MLSKHFIYRGTSLALGTAQLHGLQSQGRPGARDSAVRGALGCGKEGMHRRDLAGSMVEGTVLVLPSRTGSWGDGGRRYDSPAIAILDADITTPVELLAVLEPAIGGLGVPRRCLTLQRLLLTDLSCLALHLLQLGAGGCRVQGR